MSKKRQNNAAYDEKKQSEYERVARLQYGPDIVNESVKRWNAYSKTQQESILSEAGQIYTDLVKALEAGVPVQDSEVQENLRRWHENLQRFYEPTLEILRGLGELYKTEPGFIAYFKKLHPSLPQYLAEGIAQYVDDLETAEIEQLLAEDEIASRRLRLSAED
ncbi:MAG TPA: TipAS antibiotic-recognition domain-containing protein [Aggregatilineales bacterium]|nr:TipAS antibiotic-recognition domain-containing protein [Aggregatilineales bacterium]